MEAMKSGRSTWGFDLFAAHEHGARAVDGADDHNGEQCRRGRMAAVVIL